MKHCAEWYFWLFLIHFYWTEDIYLFTLKCQPYLPKHVANFVDVKLIEVSYTLKMFEIIFSTDLCLPYSMHGPNLRLFDQYHNKYHLQQQFSLRINVDMTEIQHYNLMTPRQGQQPLVWFHAYLS